MTIESSNMRNPKNGNCNGNEAKTITQKNLYQIKEDYCNRLKGKLGELSESEVTKDGTLMMYEKKKCVFVKTEKNYQMLRNLELKVGVELIQASDEIKKNVASSILQNDTLLAALKAVSMTAKNAKVAFANLRESAAKLDAGMNDSCNSGQLKILGCSSENCNDNEKLAESNQLPNECQDACRVLQKLVEKPIELSQEIDIICNSVSDIIGIQSFSNIKSLEKFQQDFATNAKTFDDLILSQIINATAGLKKSQDDLTLAIKSQTQSSYALYNKRNELETLVEVKDYLCCHKCNCIGDCGCNEGSNDENNRFKKCKCDICDICKEVTEIYCIKDNDGASCD
ncbi:hypothetical protein [Sphingobacterium cellulitidis]|uniref:hypothetical protein n=1 Tax=Sphingobacterium cellulitidis TaxID=1768011 RepID=UPI000B9438C4|nr:hypothetical protein CHT99_08060 [Sphingobacterium cellulitidis]